jgi:deoxyribonuclease (pyrimidine dimer)
MVRINLIDPKSLADQHLIAEYNEILMLLGHVDKFPVIKDQSKEYCLGKGHITFFKDKIKYLKERHELIKKEMKRRGFKSSKTINLNKYPKEYRKYWKPKNKDKEIIKKRLIAKINLKPGYYRYERERKPKGFFINLIKNGE